MQKGYDMNYTKKRLLEEQKKLSSMAPADRVVAEQAIMAEVEPESEVVVVETGLEFETKEVEAETVEEKTG